MVPFVTALVQPLGDKLPIDGKEICIYVETKKKYHPKHDWCWVMGSKDFDLDQVYLASPPAP